MPRPWRRLDRLITAGAASAVILLALSKTAAMPLLRLLSSVLTLTVLALLSAKLLGLAARALGPQRAAGS